MNPLAELVRAAAGAGRGRVTDARVSLTLDEAVVLAEEIAREVTRSSTRTRPVVAVVLPSSAAAVLQLLAAVVGDHTVCFLDPSNGPRTAAVVDALDPDVVVDAAGLRPRPTGAGGRRPESGPAGYVAMSSGTTGSGAKGVLTTWECLADFVPHGIAALDVAPGDGWAEPNHPAYDLALTNWLVALGAGASLHVSSALSDRLRPLGFVARRGATHVRWAPGYIDLAAAEARRGTPCGVRVWGSGGDRLTQAQASTVLDLGVETLVNTYGTSESGGFASTAAYRSVGELRAVEGSVSVGSGRLGSWGVELVNENHSGTGSDVIAVHSPHVGVGYLFGGHDQDYPRWEPGRVVTGDLGVLRDGHLFCLGRLGRLVKRNASFVNLDDVDTALRDLRDLVSFTVATRDGSLVTLVEGTAQPLAAVREDLAARVAPAILPDALLSVVALPRLGNGKTDQAGALRLAEQVVAGGRRANPKFRGAPRSGDT